MLLNLGCFVLVILRESKLSLYPSRTTLVLADREEILGVIASHDQLFVRLEAKRS